MKLSIITINRNNALGLQRTLDSVRSQQLSSLPSFSLTHIIIDGASTDGSVDIIREYEKQWSSFSSSFSLKWLSEPDSGIYNAMDKGIQIALANSDNIGDEHHYIQILNSGDCLASNDVISRMYSALQANHYPALMYGNMIKAYPNGKRHRDTCGGGLYTPQSFLYFYLGTLNHDCAWIQTDLFRYYGLYNETMRICSDWEWYVRVIALGGVIPVYTNIDVTIFDMTGVSENDGRNHDLILRERREYLETILPTSVLRDYDLFACPITQYQRLRKYHLWGIVYFIERVLFKFEKWGILK